MWLILIRVDVLNALLFVVLTSDRLRRNTNHPLVVDHLLLARLSQISAKAQCSVSDIWRRSINRGDPSSLNSISSKYFLLLPSYDWWL